MTSTRTPALLPNSQKKRPLQPRQSPRQQRMPQRQPTPLRQQRIRQRQPPNRNLAT
jgi:hypothetical protein